MGDDFKIQEFEPRSSCKTRKFLAIYQELLGLYQELLGPYQELPGLYQE